MLNTVPRNFKLVWERITFSRLTVAYFILTIIHFAIQVGFQSWAFSINAAAAKFLGSIVEQGVDLTNTVPFLNGDQLRLCTWVPANLNTDGEACRLVWDGRPGKNSIDSSVSTPANAVSPSTLLIQTPVVTASPRQTISSSFLTSRLPQTVTILVSPAPTGRVPQSTEEDEDEDEGSRRPDERDTEKVKLLFDGLFSALGDSLDRRDGHSHVPVLSAFLENGQKKVNISGLGFNDVSATLDANCLWSLSYPLNALSNTKREDIVFIAFQFWVAGVSIVALLNESIPHVIASLVTHVLATGWAAFQISHTANFRANYNRVITNGACNGVSLLSGYWRERALAEIPGLALNVFALILSAFFTMRLVKLFGWQTFKRVGASITINRVYKLVLTLSIFIQISLFFMVVTVSLWLDQLLNTVIGDLVTFLTLYKASSITTLVLMAPWFACGWFGVRKELRTPMFIFLFLSFLYLGAWGVMFFSTTFRWTFLTWRFFSVVASISVFLTISCFALGVVCRFNFGKGLVRYLNAHQTLPGNDTVYRSANDIEKVAFPDTTQPIPTYSAAFGSGQEVPPPSQMFGNMGPRFFNKGAQPFDRKSPTSPYGAPITPPAATLARAATASSTHSTASLVRSESQRSEVPSYYQYNLNDASPRPKSPRQTSPRQGPNQRWVIE